MIGSCAAISTSAPSTIGRETSPTVSNKSTEIPTREQDALETVVRIGSLEFIVEVAADCDEQIKDYVRA